MILTAVPIQVKIEPTVWAQMGWIDVLFLALLALGIFIGLKKGLGKILPWLLAIMTAETVVLEYSQFLAEFLHQKLAFPFVTIHVILFALIAVLSILSVLALLYLLSQVATVQFKPLVSNVFGALLGGLQALLFLSLIASFLSLFPIPFLKETFTSRSISGSYLVESGKEIHHFLRQWIPENFQVKEKQNKEK